MATAAIMVSHQVAARAFRDAAFLHAWPVTALPAMAIATAVLTGVMVPLFSSLLARFPPTAVVAGGFALSAAAHAAEWTFYDSGRPLAVVIYLHLAGVAALLISGFWSTVAERYDAATARAAYGRIGATGTAAGIAGSIAAERIAATIAPHAVLVLLSLLHAACAVGVATLGRAPALLPRGSDAEGSRGVREAFRSRYVRTIAAFAILTSASAAMLDFLLKTNARATFGTGPDLLRFFALFYGLVQVATFLAQTASGRVLSRLGVSGTLDTLPTGVGAASAIALMFPGWASIAAVRGAESVLRSSLYRGGYELLFVPMDAATRRRAKTILDVVCDRIGEAAGSLTVQLLLAVGVIGIENTLLRLSVLLSIAAIWIGRQFSGLYLQVVEDQLVKHGDAPSVSVVSEAGWTIVQVPAKQPARAADAAIEPRREATPEARLDPQLRLLAELRSGDVARVTAALGQRSAFERMHVAQLINLLAWDDVLPAAREALEQAAPSHVGLLVDAMLDASTAFTIRRRLPRILASCPVQRSVDGLVSGLNDSRFEVRYHCSRAIARITTRGEGLSIDQSRVIAVVERELAVPPQIWRGYRLLDRPDDPAPRVLPADTSSRHVDYIFLLLSTIVAREPLNAAARSIHSANSGVRGLAVEYLDQVLPPAVAERLRQMMASIESDADPLQRSAAE
jgi:AAA family ATP:ADP antiporter